jgi:hypothetical protein
MTRQVDPGLISRVLIADNNRERNKLQTPEDFLKFSKELREGKIINNRRMRRVAASNRLKIKE